jgi:NADPH-dependent 2,4-dienoyl-CoA reductase/sulfur reductase-like enzyme
VRWRHRKDTPELRNFQGFKGDTKSLRILLILTLIVSGSKQDRTSTSSMIMNKAEASPTVLIVGGGLAGLFCALECTRNGFSTTVLEARDAVQTAGACLYSVLYSIP